MKHLALLLLATAALAAGCATRNPPTPPSRPTGVWELIDAATGKTLNRTEDNSGQTALAGGQAFDTTEAKLVEHLGPSFEVSASKNGVTMLRIARAKLTTANEKRLDELKAKRKETAQAALKALEAGLDKNADELAGQVVALGGQIADLIRTAQPEPQRGDQGAVTAILVSTAPNQVDMVRYLGQHAEGTIVSEHGNRPTFEQTTRQTVEDTTTEKDLEVLVDGLVALFTEPDRETDEAGKPFVADPATVNPPAEAGEPSTLHYGPEALARVRRWYPNANLGGGNNDANARARGEYFLWKPASDSNGKLAIHTPNTWHVLSIKVGDEVRTNPDGIGNGYRPLWRFGKAGAAYGAPVQVELSVNGKVHTVTIPKGGERFDKPIGNPPSVSVVPPSGGGTTPAPAATEPANGEPAALTAEGELLLRSNVAALVEKVLVLTHAETPASTQKFFATREGNAWSTGQPLSAYPAAVYQIWFTAEPPADVPHHQDFFGTGKKVAHITQAGAFKPETTRSP